jgi:hypothetical protein
MAIPEKTPYELRRENAEVRERVAINALTKLQKLFELEAAGWASTPIGHPVSRKLKAFADRCAQALKGDITGWHDGETDDATNEVFKIQTDLNREATVWEKDYFPVSDLYNGLAKECSKEWHRAIDREKSGEQSDNPIHQEGGYFGKPPTEKIHELFEVVVSLVNEHVKEKGRSPTRNQIWNSLMDRYSDSYDPETQAILDLSGGKGLNRAGLNKNLGAWKYKSAV